MDTKYGRIYGASTVWVFVFFAAGKSASAVNFFDNRNSVQLGGLIKYWISNVKINKCDTISLSKEGGGRRNTLCTWRVV